MLTVGMGWFPVGPNLFVKIGGANPMTSSPLSVTITGGANPSSYRVTTAGGATIHGIRSIDFHAETNEVPSATLSLICPNMSLWEINASIPLGQLELLAEAHGYKLVPIEECRV